MSYWFDDWMREHKLGSENRLRSYLLQPKGLASLQNAAPRPHLPKAAKRSEPTTITAGKGIDLTGGLGCRHINCLKKEIDGLFRHIWHYFDRVVLPDEALANLVALEQRQDREAFIERLIPFALAIRHLYRTGGDAIRDAVLFETRMPGCDEHFEQHAQEAGIDQAIANTFVLAREISSTADVRWTVNDASGHVHVDYQLQHSAFEHTEWGSLCSERIAIPVDEHGMRQSIGEAVVKRYLAQLSADALAARRSKTGLGSTIPFYRRLLAVQLAPMSNDVAFELALPIAEGVSTEHLMKIRQEEKVAFERFRQSIRTAIETRLRQGADGDSSSIANEIKRDIIEPELRSIKDRLSAATKMSNHSGLTGVVLGAASAMVGLLSPIAGAPIGTGLAVAGAVTALTALKKSKDDLLTARKEVSLSDMYFLWRAHRH
ncbi:MAG: hypothetical protein ACREYB_13680 [Casimicrobiaceae bacterium]